LLKQKIMISLGILVITLIVSGPLDSNRDDPPDPIIIEQAG
jgi:hypothetical protein